LNVLQPAWFTSVVSSVRKSGGLLATWDPNKFDLVPYLCGGGIFLTSHYLENKRELALINVYGPCNDRKYLWDKVVDRGLL